MRKSYLFVIFLQTLILIYVAAYILKDGYHLKKLMENEEETRETTSKIPPTPIHLSLHMSEKEFEEGLFKFYSHISYNCKLRERMGKVGDGGWDVCLDPPFQLQAPCLVYSFGINNDWSFDDAISSKKKCTVHSFDPSMHQKDHNRSALVSFHNLAIGGTNRMDDRRWTYRTLRRLREDLKHANITMDVLKMDVERAEFESLTQTLMDGDLDYVKQLAFELHIRGDKKKTIRAYKLLRHLELAGFRKYFYHPNNACHYVSPYTNITRTACHELYYINKNFIA